RAQLPVEEGRGSPRERGAAPRQSGGVVPCPVGLPVVQPPLLVPEALERGAGEKEVRLLPADARPAQGQGGDRPPSGEGERSPEWPGEAGHRYSADQGGGRTAQPVACGDPPEW